MNKILVEKYNNNDDHYVISDLIKNNSEVGIGDLLFCLETSKADIEVISEFIGFIHLNPNIKNGDKVVVGQNIAVISENKDLTFDFDKIELENSNQIPSNFTKSAYKYAVENNINISDFSNKELVTLNIIKDQNEISLKKLNKPKIVIVGASGQGMEVLSIIQKQSAFEFSGFIDVLYPKEKKYFGYDIIGNDDNYDEIYQSGIHNIVVAGGWLKGTKIISNIFNKAKLSNFNFPNIIHPSAIISENVILGCGIQIFANAFIGPNVSIGDGCVINNGSIVSHDSETGKFCFVAPGAVIAGNVSVGDYVVLGINSSVYLRKTVPNNYILENNKAYI